MLKVAWLWQKKPICIPECDAKAGAVMKGLGCAEGRWMVVEW
jgi:hypothetical protein